MRSDLPSQARRGVLAVERSALWAAFGDALGFPTELASASLVQRRLGDPEGPLRPWPRRIGGRGGPTVELPAGCTSDDTQLRLAVGRCIRASGRFDAEAFSKIELPVFLSYQLGAGRGTKAAASNLIRRTVRWSDNFFDRSGQRYVEGGGNGAAMRVQPHVWAGFNGRLETYLPPVVRDTLTTHGHPRALLGAALHAISLGTTLRQGEIPAPSRWQGMAAYLERLAEVVDVDDELDGPWRATWAEHAGRPWHEALAEAHAELVNELAAAVDAADDVTAGQPPEIVYARLCEQLGGMDPARRGAGDISAVLALWLAWAFRSDALEGVRTAAGLLGSDTDTVASMAGALLGAVAGDGPPEAVLDAELIAAEAGRLAGLAHDIPTSSFPHPDPLHWQPPTSQSDALVEADGRLVVTGLGPVTELSEPMRGQGTGVWQWVNTDYGQRLLVKRRQELRGAGAEVLPRHRPATADEQPAGAPEPRADLQPPSTVASDAPPRQPELAAERLAEQGFPADQTYAWLLHYADVGAAAAAAFGAHIADLRRRRQDTARDQ